MCWFVEITQRVVNWIISILCWVQMECYLGNDQIKMHMPLLYWEPYHQMKAKSYSTTFQMHEMHCSFLGLDTMNLTDYGKFDFLSNISGWDELLSYCGRSDIRVSSLDMLLPVLFLHGWLRTMMIGHLLSGIQCFSWQWCAAWWPLEWLSKGCNVCFVHGFYLTSEIVRWWWCSWRCCAGWCSCVR
jgi:hypothetical protein